MAVILPQFLTIEIAPNKRSATNLIRNARTLTMAILIDDKDAVITKELLIKNGLKIFSDVDFEVLSRTSGNIAFLAIDKKTGVIFESRMGANGSSNLIESRIE